MDKKNKKIFIMNIVKFVLGSILLLLAFGYLQSHPAEKRSRNTGMQVIVEKISTFFQKTTGVYDSSNEYKKSMLNSYYELIFVAETTSCITGTMKDDLYETYEILKNSTTEEFKKKQENYYLIRSQYRQHIEDTCEK